MDPVSIPPNSNRRCCRLHTDNSNQRMRLTLKNVVDVLTASRKLHYAFSLLQDMGSGHEAHVEQAHLLGRSQDLFNLGRQENKEGAQFVRAIFQSPTGDCAYASILTKKSERGSEFTFASDIPLHSVSSFLLAMATAWHVK